MQRDSKRNKTMTTTKQLCRKKVAHLQVLMNKFEKRTILIKKLEDGAVRLSLVQNHRSLKPSLFENDGEISEFLTEQEHRLMEVVRRELLHTIECIRETCTEEQLLEITQNPFNYEDEEDEEDDEEDDLHSKDERKAMLTLCLAKKPIDKGLTEGQLLDCAILLNSTHISPPLPHSTLEDIVREEYLKR